MKTYFNRYFGLLLAIIMVISMLPNSIFKASATNASTQGTISTGSTITYGSYPQTKVTDSSLITALNAQPLQGDSTVIYGGSKYKRVYFAQYTPYCATVPTTADYSNQDDNGYYINTEYWFKFEPIKWRVLSNTNGELFVLAEKILDAKAYNQDYTGITWESCTLRSWLNVYFYSKAFNLTERVKIKTSTVINEDNPIYEGWCEGGNNTNDKLFPLSYSEVINTAYGFNSSRQIRDTARMTKGTDFAKCSGLYVSTGYWYPGLGNSGWSLRSPGNVNNRSGFVYWSGEVSDYSNDVYFNSGVRPAMKINLSSDIITSVINPFPYSNQKCEQDLAELTAAYCVQINKSANGTELKSMLSSKANGQAGGYSCIYDSQTYVNDGNDPDGIGFIFAVKRINGNENLITVVIRGTNKAQWQGDMDATGQTYEPGWRTHHSFWVAKETVKTKLAWYMSQINGPKTLLITGHSRGGAVANLLAKDMTDANYKVYAYTYATPNVGLDTTLSSYNNIYNFCFSDDFVARSPLSPWGYGKYGITFWTSAQSLYATNTLFRSYMNWKGTNHFNKRATDDFVKQLNVWNRGISDYYNLPLPDKSWPHVSITTYSLLRDKISPIMAGHVVIGGLATLAARYNDSCLYIIDYFLHGFQTYINDTHQPYSYYQAVMCDGFGTKSGTGRFTANTVIPAKSNADANAISGADITNPNIAELQQMRDFLQQGDNLSILGWDINDISTWSGLSWSDTTENRVQTIDFGNLNLAGSLDLNEFSGLQSLNCSGNALTAINFGGCFSLTNANVSHNSLIGVSLEDSTSLENIDCSWNQITSLDVGNCAALKYLYCEQNSLTSIDVSKNSNLIEFYCNGNDLAQIDVTANVALNSLSCDNNYLDIQDGSAFMTEIQNIMTRDNAWVSYSPQKVPEAAPFNASDVAKITDFANIGTNLEILSVDLATPKDWYFAQWVQSGSEYRISQLDFTGLGLTGNLDLSGMTGLTILNCDENALTGLNLNGCTSLEHLSSRDSKLQSLTIANCTALKTLSCENNYLNVSEGTSLRTGIDSINSADNELIVFEPQMILAEVSAFNSTEYSVLSTFAQTGDNLALLGWDISKPGEWSSVVWQQVNGEYRVAEMNMSSMAVTGNLDLNAMEHLTVLNCAGSGISSVSLPATMKTVGESSFSGCNNLTSVTTPQEMETIESNAFSNCESLAVFELGDQTSNIGIGAFAGCENLSTITVPADNAFFKDVSGVLFSKDETRLVYYPPAKTETAFTIPDNVTNLQEGAFLNSKNLVSVILGKGLTAVPKAAFSRCVNLKEVVLPETITNIDEYAFAYCPELKEIVLPASVTAIQDYAFYGCMGLEKVIADKTLTDIGEHAFAYFEDEYLPLPSLTIYCYDGSAAYSYAVDNNIQVYTFKFTIPESSTVKVNLGKGFVYGLDPGISSLEGYMEPVGGYTFDYILTGKGFGTGTIVNICANEKSGTILENYTLIFFGDVNGDGRITVVDALMTLQNASGLISLDDVERFAGDVNNSGSISVIDALKILQYASGVITGF